MAKGTKVTDIVKLMVHKYPINQKWKPNELISFYWNVYTSEFESNNSVNGGVFEQLLVLALLREKISPVYVQAELAFVPNVILDIVLYNRKTPITISAKTTLRERWKQADLKLWRLNMCIEKHCVMLLPYLKMRCLLDVKKKIVTWG